jgi:hypothetical protein
MVLLPDVSALVALTRYRRTPGHGCWGPGHVLSWVTRRSYSRVTRGETLLNHGNRIWRKVRYRSSLGLVFSGWWSLVFSQEWWDYTWYEVSDSLAICRSRESVCVQIFWVITSGLWYPGYRTPTVAPEPSIEWSARAVHWMGGRIGTHM